MTKRERVVAALGGQPIDRPPVAFWRHAPDVDHTATGLADAMLAFHRRFDLDLVKVMSSGVYCVEDWGCRVAYTGAPCGARRTGRACASSIPAKARWAASSRRWAASRGGATTTRRCSTPSSRR